MTTDSLSDSALPTIEAALFGAGAAVPAGFEISTLIAAMLSSGNGISDLIFSPGRPPQVERHGELTPVAIPDLPILRPEHTCRVARDLLGRNEQAIPKHSGGRVAVLEILKSTLRTREYIDRGEGEGRSLLDAMRDGEIDGMQHFDGAIERLVRDRTVSVSMALAYATNPDNLRLALLDFLHDEEASPAPTSA